MIVQNVNKDTFTVTMIIGFLDLIFIKNINDEDQFVTIKNHTTRENLTHIFNKDGLYSSFPIKDEEVCDLIKLCNRFIDHCSYGTSVSADTTYDNMQKIYNAIEEDASNDAIIINIKKDLIWYLDKDRQTGRHKRKKKTI